MSIIGKSKEWVLEFCQQYPHSINLSNSKTFISKISISWLTFIEQLHITSSILSLPQAFIWSQERRLCFWELKEINLCKTPSAVLPIKIKGIVNSSFNNGEVGFIANSYTGKKKKKTPLNKIFKKLLEGTREQSRTGRHWSGINSWKKETGEFCIYLTGETLWSLSPTKLTAC